MANKYILVPEEIYKGLTASPCPQTVANESDPKLSFSKNALDNVMQLPIDSEKKNVLYNQELQRFLHLRKEQTEKPLRVVLTNEEAVDEIVDGPVSSGSNDVSLPLNNQHIKKKAKKDRARRSRTPSPEEKPPPKKSRKHFIEFGLGFRPRIWN
jgi:hypothetical protein